MDLEPILFDFIVTFGRLTPVNAIYDYPRQEGTSVGLLVCRQDYTKSTDRISTKLGGRTGLSTEKIPFCVNPGVFVLFFFNNARQDLVLH